MMNHCRLAGIMLSVLSGLMLATSGHAQGPPEGNRLTLDLLGQVEQLKIELRSIRGELEVQRHQIDLLQQEQETLRQREQARERALSGPAVTSSAVAANAPAVPVTPPAPTGGAVTPVPQASPVQAPATSQTLAPAVPTASQAPTPSQVPAPSTPVPPPAQSTATAPSNSEQTAFDAALGELREGRYQEAISGFQRFLDTYPASKLVSDAQYWLGESQYINRDYKAAKETFINLSLRFPQSARVPDTLLKLGYIYGELGDVNRAREVLEKLKQVYPTTQAARLADRRLRSLN